MFSSFVYSYLIKNEEQKIYFTINYSTSSGKSDAKILSFGIFYSNQQSTEDEYSAMTMGVGIGIEFGVVLDLKTKGYLLRLPLRFSVVGDTMPIEATYALGYLFTKEDNSLTFDMSAGYGYLFYGYVGWKHIWTFNRHNDVNDKLTNSGLFNSGYWDFYVGIPFLQRKK